MEYDFTRTMEQSLDDIAEGNLVKLMQDSFVETLADAVCLRVTCFDFGVLYAVYT